MRLAALCLLAAFPAYADECPATPEDAARGLTVAYKDGSKSEMVLDIASGEVTEDWTQSDGYASRNTLAAGLHLTALLPLTKTDGQPDPVPITYVFETPLPPTVTAGQSWSTRYRTGDEAGWTSTYSGMVGENTTLTIGACSFSSMPVSIMLKSPDFTSLVQVDYLPALRLSVLRGFGEALGPATAVIPASITVKAAP